MTWVFIKTLKMDWEKEFLLIGNMQKFAHFSKTAKRLLSVGKQSWKQFQIFAYQF